MIIVKIIVVCDAGGLFLRGADAGAEVVQMSMVCGDCVLVHRVWQRGDLGVTCESRDGTSQKQKWR